MRTLLAVTLIGLCVAGDAWAETMRSLAAAKPAPGNERRIALVIGNSAYKSAPLRNPVNDARAMATTLAETGFSVILVEDATLAGMRRAVREFGSEKLTVAAGTFDTTRVQVRVRIAPPPGGEGGSQELTLWYAARAKRPVRIRSIGRGSAAGESTEFELAAYRLGGGPAVGDEHGITALSFGR